MAAMNRLPASVLPVPLAGTGRTGKAGRFRKRGGNGAGKLSARGDGWQDSGPGSGRRACRDRKGGTGYRRENGWRTGREPAPGKAGLHGKVPAVVPYGTGKPQNAVDTGSPDGRKKKGGRPFSPDVPAGCAAGREDA